MQGRSSSRSLRNASLLNPTSYNGPAVFVFSKRTIQSHYGEYRTREDLTFFLDRNRPYIGIPAVDADMLEKPSLENILMRIPYKCLNRSNTFWVRFPEGTLMLPQRRIFYVALNGDRTRAYRIVEPADDDHTPPELHRTCEAVFVGIGIPRYENMSYRSIVSKKILICIF